MKTALVWLASFARAALVLRLVRALIRACMSTPYSRIGTALRALFDPNTIRTMTSRRLGPKYLVTDGLFGERLRVNVNDHIGWQTFIFSYFDLTPLSLARLFHEGASGKRGIFIDVGANIGTTSVPVAKCGIDVLGIEASPRALYDLAHNIALNSPLPYSAVNLAVTSPAAASSDVYCQLYSPSGNLGAASTIKNWNPSRSGMTTELARMATLDRIVEFYGVADIALIKIDIEGLEYEAMMGLARTLEAACPPVIFEWRPDVARAAGVELKDLRAVAPAHYAFYAVWRSSVETASGIKVLFTLDDFHPDLECENVLAISARYLAKHEAIARMVGQRKFEYFIPRS